MDSRLLSGHQLHDIEPYLDTVVLSIFDPSPLDVATPLAASQLIGERLAIGVQERFRGRSVRRTAGESTFVHPTRTDHLNALAVTNPFRVEHGVIVTDRVLLQDRHELHSNGVHWIIVDWWHWLRERVPDRRLADALMYLSVACPSYRESTACKMIGFTEDVLNAMTREGEKLLVALEEDISEAVMQSWSLSSPADAEQKESETDGV